jgi:DNA replicative helicase MCM subunit Mcm2 (Cdc46/Mcm family)
MRIAEAFCKMRLSDFCSTQDIDRAIAVTVDSFVGSQKVSCKKSLARAFAKYVTEQDRNESRDSWKLLTHSTRYTLRRPEAPLRKRGAPRGGSPAVGTVAA